MNKIFKVVFNRAIGRFVVASEVAKGIVKSTTMTATLIVPMISFAATTIGVDSTGNNVTNTENFAITGNNNSIDNSDNVVITGSSNDVNNVIDANITGGDNKLNFQNKVNNITVNGTGNTIHSVASDGFDGDLGRNADLSVLGHENILSDNYSVRIWGNRNDVESSSNSTILGKRNNLKNSYDSKVVGSNNRLLNGRSTVIGDFNNSENSIIIGNESKAFNDSMVFGNNSNANDQSIALGHNSSASNGNVAIGNESLADGLTLNNEAFLVGGQAQGEVSVGGVQRNSEVGLLAECGEVGPCVGDSNVVTRRITNVAAGSNEYDAANIQQLKAVLSVAENAKTHFVGINNTDETAPNYNGEGATGSNAIAVGVNANANGHHSSAVGENANAQGEYSNAFGFGTNAQGIHTTAIGSYALADGTFSNAIGYASEAISSSNAFGTNAKAIGSGSNAIGAGAVAEGSQAIAIGSETNALGENNIVMGSYASSVGNSSIAIGESSQAADNFTTVLGGASKATSQAATAVGYNSQADGWASTTLGADTKATGLYATAIGATANANGSQTIAIGRSATANDSDSVAIGSNASANYKGVAIGSNASVETEAGIALGSDSVSNSRVNSQGYAPASPILSNTTINAIRATQATHGAVSIGNDSNGVYRQLTGLAAGTKDTDATNLAQLKAVEELTKAAVKYDQNPDGTTNFDSTSLQGQQSVIVKDGKYGVDTVQSGGTAISNVATATKADQAVNKGQMDVAIAGVQDGVNGAVKYDRNTDGSINYDSAKLQGKDATIGKDGKYGIDTVQSGGTAISNVATATKADQAVNKGQMDVAIAGVQDGVNGAVKYDRNTDGSINFNSTSLQGQQSVIVKDGKYGVDVVQSGGTTINNVATATKSDQAVNKGQVDLEFAKRDEALNGAVKYDRNTDGSINFNSTSLQGQQSVIVKDGKYGVDTVQSGGTAISNVATATKADQAVNKGQMDVAIAGVQDGVNGAVKYDRNTDGSINFNSTSLQGQQSVIVKDGKYGVDVVQSGGTTINNVATATKSDQAVNKGQVDLELAKRDEALNGAVKYDRNTDGSINFNSTSLQGQQSVIVKDGKYGVDTVQSGGTAISNVATATKADQAVNKGQMDVAIAGVQDGVNGAVKYDRNTDGSINFNSTSLQGQQSVIVKDGKYGVDVVQSGGTTINNVATATKSDQAVNKGQVDLELAKRDEALNGAVKYDRNTDGSINFNSTSLQGQQSVIVKDGKYGVDTVQSGGTAISNVATATKADQAVNKGQMDVAIAGVQDGVNGAVKYDRNTDGSINFNSTSLQGQQSVIVKDGKYGVDVVQSGGTTINNVATATKSDQAVNKGQVDLELAKRDEALNGAVKYDRNTDGSINFNSTSLQGQQSVIVKDGKYGVDTVQSGGTAISNVATATKADQAVNKGQMDVAIAGVQDGVNGAVKYDRNTDGSINYDSAKLQGKDATIGKDGKYGIDTVQSGGTAISNVATATKADQAVNKGQMDVAIAGVQDGVNGAVKYDRNTDGSINFNSTSLQGQQSVIVKDGKYGVDVVQSGGTTINNVATATKSDQAVNKGQVDLEFAKRDEALNGAVKYDRNTDGSINFNSTSLQGQQSVIVKDGKYGVDVVQSGGTTINNVATATKSDQAVNKGQVDLEFAKRDEALNGAVKYDRNTDGSINFNSTSLQGQQSVIVKDGKYGVDTVQSGGTAISNVATATKADQAVNKGQMDVAIAGVQDGVNGAVKYDRNTDGSINYDSAKLQGKDAAIGKDGKYGIDTVQSGGTAISNVATATKADQAVNKGQMDVAIAGVQDGVNGTVKYDRNTDGSINYDSAKLQGKDATIGKDGKYGIDTVQSGGTAISNVATATKADQAVNKGQMDVAIAGVQDGVNGAVKYDRNTDGSINYDSAKLQGKDATIGKDGKYGIDTVQSGGTAISNVATATKADQAVNKGQMDVAIASVDSKINNIQADINSVVKYDRNTDGSINFNSTSLQGQQSVIVKDGKYGVDTVQSGGTAISNVATATKADQAVNKGQMDVAIAGVQDGVNGAVKYDRNTDGSINYDSAKLQGKDATIGKDGKYGIDTVQSGGTAISNVATATKADQAVNKGQMDVAIAGVQDGVNGAVKYDRNTDGSINYDSAKLQGKDATIGKDGKYGVDVVQSGGTTINNVATATKSDQAVNKGQVDLELAKLRDYSDQGNTKTLNTANSYTDRKVEELQSVFTQNMGKLEDKLSAGVAGAMAMASLAQPTTGRGTWGVALAGFNGQGALAWGMNGLSEDGKYIIKSAASFDTQGNIGGSISFNRQF